MNLYLTSYDPDRRVHTLRVVRQVRIALGNSPAARLSVVQSDMSSLDDEGLPVLLGASDDENVLQEAAASLTAVGASFDLIDEAEAAAEEAADEAEAAAEIPLAAARVALVLLSAGNGNPVVAARAAALLRDATDDPTFEAAVRLLMVAFST